MVRMGVVKPHHLLAGPLQGILEVLESPGVNFIAVPGPFLIEILCGAGLFDDDAPLAIPAPCTPNQKAAALMRIIPPRVTL
jgi:hypothetical protein